MCVLYTSRSHSPKTDHGTATAHPKQGKIWDVPPRLYTSVAPRLTMQSIGEQIDETTPMTECDEQGHEWVSLDKGETIECKHCDTDITIEEVEALHEDPRY